MVAAGAAVHGAVAGEGVDVAAFGTLVDTLLFPARTGLREMGVMAIRAGSRINVYIRARVTPILEKIPRSAIGAISAVAKERNPPAVVKLVIRMARPE